MPLNRTDGRRRWLLPIVAVLLFCLGFESSGLQLALLRVGEEFALSTTMMGMMASAHYLAIFVMSPIFGILSDRLGKKGLTTAAVGIFIAGCLLSVAAGRPGWLLLGLFTTGAGYSIIEGLSSAALTDAYPTGSGRVLNLAQSSFCAGGVVGPLVINWLTGRYGADWRVAFLIAGCGAALCVLPLLATPFPAARPAQPAGGAGCGAPKARRRLSAPLLLLLGCIFMYGCTEVGTGSYLDAIFTLELGAGQLGSYALSAFWLAMLLSRILFGVLHLNATRLAAVCTFGVGLSLAGLALGQTALWGMACAALIGFCLGPCWALLVSLAVEQAPHRSGSVVTLMGAMSGLGATLMPAAAGRLTDSFGLRAAVAAMAACGLAGALGLVVFSRLRRRGAPAPENPE